jgi:hypothetical protein
MPYRIAVQISGEFRTLYATWQSFQRNVLDISGDIEVDLFIHTWKRDQEGLGTFPFAERGNWHKTVYVSGHDHGLMLYRPKAYEIEDFNEKKELHRLPRQMSMFYSIYRANEVRKAYEEQSGIHYDYVMRYRTDLVIEENLYIHLLPLLGQSFLMIPLSKRVQQSDGPCVQDSGESYCDWFAMGTPEAMDIYARTFLTCLHNTHYEMPECMLAYNLKYHGITKETILRRPALDFYLVDSFGKMR